MSSFTNPHTDNDLTRLREFLSETLKRSGVAPNPTTAGDLKLLNLACGRADETAVLADVFGHHAEAIHMTGLDIRAREIGEARERWKNLPPRANADFLVQDASKLAQLKELGSAFHSVRRSSIS